MNTIPTTSKKPKISYTVVGGARIDRLRKFSFPFTIILLNRGGFFYRSEMILELQDLKVGDIICIEGPHIPYDIEPLSRKFPDIRFLLLRDEASVGEKINLGLEEAQSKLVLIGWSNTRVIPSSLNRAFLDRIEQSEAICTLPQFKNSRGEIIPSIRIPAFIRNKLKLLPWKPGKTRQKSIVPFDYCGIYNKSKHMKIGGYDHKIRNSYWQRLDYGFRAFLWGENISYEPGFLVNYISEPVLEDNTPDESYKIFYLKNLAVKYKRGRGMLPYSRLMRYLLRSDTGLIYSFKEFREVRKWVTSNCFQFKKDAAALVNQWEAPE